MRPVAEAQQRLQEQQHTRTRSDPQLPSPLATPVTRQQRDMILNAARRSVGHPISPQVAALTRLGRVTPSSPLSGATTPEENALQATETPAPARAPARSAPPPSTGCGCNIM